MQQSEPLRLTGRIEVKDAGGVASRPIEAGDETASDKIVGEYANDRDIFRGRDDSPHRSFAANGDEDSDRAMNEF